MNLQVIERIPDQVGYLVLNEDGAVVSSGGDLENDEKTADIVHKLISVTDNIDSEAFNTDEGFKKISVVFPEYSFIICLSNKKYYVVKRRFNPNAVIPVAEPNLIDLQVPISNSINT